MPLPDSEKVPFALCDRLIDTLAYVPSSPSEKQGW